MSKRGERYSRSRWAQALRHKRRTAVWRERNSVSCGVANGRRHKHGPKAKCYHCYGRGGEHRGPGSKRPIDHLKERYAKGEINEEEYERIKRQLREE